MSKSNSIYKLIFIVVAIISTVLLTGEIALAWFMSESFTDNSDTGIKVIGRIDLDVTYDFSFYNDALSPDTIVTENKVGDDISTYIKTSGDNNIDQVFVKVIFKTDMSQVSLHFVDNLIPSTVTSYDSATCDDKWILSGSEESEVEGKKIYTYEYYYVGLVGSTDVRFNRGYYINNHLDNSFIKNDVYIRMEVFGLQSQYGAYLEDADWSTAPEIFTSYASLVTGY